MQYLVGGPVESMLELESFKFHTEKTKFQPGLKMLGSRSFRSIGRLIKVCVDRSIKASCMFSRNISRLKKLTVVSVLLLSVSMRKVLKRLEAGTTERVKTWY